MGSIEASTSMPSIVASAILMTMAPEALVVVLKSPAARWMSLYLE